MNLYSFFWKAFGFDCEKNWVLIDSPGEKINEIKNQGDKISMPQDISFLDDLWDKELRNSIGHAAYAFYPNEIRTS